MIRIQGVTRDLARINYRIFSILNWPGIICRITRATTGRWSFAIPAVKRRITRPIARSLTPDAPAVVEPRFFLTPPALADHFALTRPSRCSFLPRRGFWPKDASLPEDASRLFQFPAGFDGGRRPTANPAEQGRGAPLLHDRAGHRAPPRRRTRQGRATRAEGQP